MLTYLFRTTAGADEGSEGSAMVGAGAVRGSGETGGFNDGSDIACTGDKRPRVPELIVGTVEGLLGWTRTLDAATGTRAR